MLGEKSMKRSFFYILLSVCLCVSLYCNAQNESASKENSKKKDKEKNDLSKSLEETKLELKIKKKIKDQLKEKKKIEELEKEQQKGFKEPKPEKKKSTLHKALMYLPNRLLDLSDIISLELGFGPEISLELTCTEWLQFGGYYGDRYFIEKGYDRQYGGGYHTGYNLAAFSFKDELAYTDYTFGTVRPYVILREDSLTPDPQEKVFKRNNVDFWRMGIHAGWIFDVEVNLHPLEVADFFTGIFLYDVTDTGK